MKSPLVLLQLPVALAMLGGATAALAEPFCRTVLPDGHIVLSRPVLDGNALVCRTAPHVQTVMPRGSAMAAAPSMRFTTGNIGPFTTGEIGPFTTGEIGPFTTGEIGPFTTFPSSTPAAGTHR